MFAAENSLFVYERSTASVIAVDAAADVRALTEIDEAFTGEDGDSAQA